MSESFFFQIKFLNFFGKAELKRNSQYFFQIQGQMNIGGFKKCYFIIYAKDWIHVEVVEVDELLWKEKMVPKLKWSV